MAKTRNFGDVIRKELENNPELAREVEEERIALELEAAAERLRKHQAVIVTDDKYKESPYAREDWFSLGGIAWDREAQDSDEAALAKAYLAEHPADDKEPVTHDWLRSMGFVRGMQAASTNILTLRGGEKAISIDLRGGDYIEKSTSISIGDGDVSAFIPAGLAPNTRGGVRLLCKALGIELKAST